MIKQLHPKNTPSVSSLPHNTPPEMPLQLLLQQISKELLQPRDEAIKAIMARVAAMKLV